jgi:hypothetical protein
MDEEQQEQDLKIVGGVVGLCVGSLFNEEMEAFIRLCDAGLAMRSYEGPAGLLGLAKVKLV